MAAANALNGLARAAIGIGAGVSLFQSSIYNVDGGFRAVMFDRLRGVQVAVTPILTQHTRALHPQTVVTWLPLRENPAVAPGLRRAPVLT